MKAPSKSPVVRLSMAILTVVHPTVFAFEIMHWGFTLDGGNGGGDGENSS